MLVRMHCLHFGPSQDQTYHLGQTKVKFKTSFIFLQPESRLELKLNGRMLAQQSRDPWMDPQDCKIDIKMPPQALGGNWQLKEARGSPGWLL